MTPSLSSRSTRTCPTEGCQVIPLEGFTYCSDHAGSERRYYDAVDRAVGMSGSVGIVPGGYFAGLLGGNGDDVRCKVINADISVHWFPTAARPGTPCLCGSTVMREQS